MVPIVAFAKAISIPTRIALRNPSTCTPGIRNAATETATPIKRISIISFIFYKIKVIGLILICFINIAITGCQSSTKKTDDFEAIKFELNADSSKIVLKGLDNNIIQSLKTDSLKNNDWQNLFVVYAGTFAEEENLSEPIQGNYTISADNHIILSP